MPSLYTQNLGIELPATGEQANTWGITVNRNMDTLDTAISGNVRLTMPSDGSAYELKIDNGQDSPIAANPVIVWNGSQAQQGTVNIDWQARRQHLYIMSNQTSGGFPIAFAQGSGPQFVLQAGYDAILYADGGGAAASVASALANPQFNNLLLTGTLSGVTTMGLGNPPPTSIPDALTINGVGVGGQLRLVMGGYGVILRNDGAAFYLLATAAGDPYGTWASIPLQINLASGAVTVGSLQASGLNVSGGRSYFNSGDTYTIGLTNGSSTNHIGTNSSGQFQVSNASGSLLMMLDQAGNARINGSLHVVSTGVMFPDGTVQTTAATTAAGFAPQPHVVARSTNTVYTNSTGLLMIVVATMGMFANTIATAWVGSGSPSTEVAQVANYTSQSGVQPLVFLVPPGWVYQVLYPQQTGPIGLCTEYY